VVCRGLTKKIEGWNQVKEVVIQAFSSHEDVSNGLP